MSPLNVPKGKYFGVVTTLAVVASDILGIGLGFLIAVYLYQKGFLAGLWLRGRHDPHIYGYVIVGCGLTLIFAASFFKAYQRDSSILNIKEWLGTLKALLVLVVVSFSVTFVFRDLAISRLVLGFGLFFTSVFVFLFRRLNRKILSMLHRRGIGVSRVAVFGTGDTARTLACRMVGAPRFGLNPVVFLTEDFAQNGQKIPVTAGRARSLLPVFAGGDVLAECLHKYDLEGVIIAEPDLPLDRLQTYIRRAKGHGLFVKYVAIGAHVPFRLASFESIGNIPLVGEREIKLGFAHRMAKRLMDIVFSIIVLILMAIPMALIALLVRLTSSGPALFKQERSGYLGKKFIMYKFRTMHIDTDSYAKKPKTQNDPRITRLGAFLRRTSLDETPQFFNVLKGEMSVVGPRPEMPFIVDEYTIEQKERLRVKPGITGLWQISADRDHPIHENIDYDLYYIYNQTILMDIIILFQTVLFAVRGI